jgi:hypothetical protein
MLPKKALKKTLTVIYCLVAFTVFLAVVSTLLVGMRQRAFKPLNPGTLAEFGIAALDKTDLSRASSIPAGAAGTDASKDTNATESLASGAKSRTSLRLARPASVADAKPALALSLSGWRRTVVGIDLGVRKRMETVAWLVKPHSIGDLAMQIGDRACQVGDYTAARDYYREALGTGKQAFSYKLVGSLRAERKISREYICAWLAWLEEDTEVATALLQESCASDNKSLLPRAVRLSILTNSDDLADYYFKRWSDVIGTEKTAQWLKRDSPDHPEIQAWKKRHAPDSPIREKSKP